jgi:signal transduction histidine kinase
MEILGLIFGGLTLIAKIEKARLKEMDTLLAGQADLVEESFRLSKGPPNFSDKHDLFGELDRDPKIFFQVVNEKGENLYLSKGPKASIRADLSKAMALRVATPHRSGELFDVNFAGDKWRATKETIEFHDAVGISMKWQVFTAIDETASLVELNTIRKMIIVGAIGLAILSSLATAAIVLLTTSNLRLFAQSLSRINPMNPVWTFPISPQSAEEGLLFASFGKMMGEMEAARQNQKLFIANASHELKTPVAGMMAALEVLLARERTAADYQAVCRDLLKTVKDLRRLTGALLDTSLIEGGKLQPYEDFSLNELLEAVMERWQPSLKAKEMKFSWNKPKQNFVTLGNRELVEVAISNLVDNAIKYSHDKGTIEVVLIGLHDGCSKLSIKDFGIGMDSVEKERLGDIFFRADPARSSKDSFGLGFANAKKILSSHGAQINVLSEPKTGTEISIIFKAV